MDMDGALLMQQAQWSILLLKEFLYPDSLLIAPLSHIPNVRITVPGSKSITNRALILAALADGKSLLSGALDADDTRVMIDSLQQLGIEVVREDDTTIQVNGSGGKITVEAAELFLSNSGTSIRFLTAMSSLAQGTIRLDGVERMRQRPQNDLIVALNALGAHVRSEFDNGCPPIVVQGNGTFHGGKVVLRAEASSQFLTALLMVAPYSQQGVEIEIEGNLRPLYVEITRSMMRQWGVDTLNVNGERFIAAPNQKYLPQPCYAIEPDASSASYFFAAAAITGGTVTVAGLSREALQGDILFATDILAEMGCKVEDRTEGITVTGPLPGQLRGVDKDMSAISDTSLTLAAIAPFANSPTTIRNVAHSRLQECDRISAVCTELKRMGVTVEERPDGYTIQPCENIQPALIETYHDHRIAMSFALVGLRVPGITINDPGCAAKTFPNYWETLRRLAG